MTASRSRRRSARREQTAAQKLCAKTGSAGEIATPVRQLWSSHSADVSDAERMKFRDRCGVNPATVYLRQIKSACRARKESAPLGKPRVFATSTAVLFR